MTTRIITTCDGCGMPIEVEAPLTLLHTRDDGTKHFCSRACLVIWAQRPVPERVRPTPLKGFPGL